MMLHHEYTQLYYSEKKELVNAKCWCIIKGMKLQLYIMYRVRSLSPSVHQTNLSFEKNRAGLKKTIEGD